ncbi:MAG: elongation factor Ts [Micromonosporaceae bacterium]|nr:elongation factor Ts [Micromonosporaceae bacterium]
MAEFTATDVKQLRDLTGAGILNCRNALTEADGDVERAIEILRIKGAKDVGKRAGRTAANGLVAHSGNALLELNCETDFVAKTPEFIALGQRLVEHAATARPADVSALLESTLDGDRTVAETVADQSAKIGEKLVLSRFQVLEGQVAAYLHRKSPDLPPQVGVLVGYAGGSDPAASGRSASGARGQAAGPGDEAAEADARGVAMQVAAMRPRYLSRDEVPSEEVESERRIAEQTAREEGKPEAAVPKIVEGRVNAFFKDSVLLEQASVVEPKKSVAQVTAEAGLTLTGFIRFEVGRS